MKCTWPAKSKTENRDRLILCRSREHNVTAGQGSRVAPPAAHIQTRLSRCVRASRARGYGSSGIVLDSGELLGDPRWQDLDEQSGASGTREARVDAP
jgi:hypothetical protein